VRMDRGLDLQTLKRYKIVYLPFQIVMRREVADLIKEYVRQGGWVVADARTATLDELDFAYQTSPGAGLDELFGAVRPDWVGQKQGFHIRMNEKSGEPAFEFEGKYFRERLRLNKSAAVLGSFTDNGDPAVIENRYGSGTAILSAVPLGASYHGNPGNAVDKLIVNFAEQSGVVPDAQFKSHDNSFLNLKVHTADSSLIVYIINSDSRHAAGALEMSVNGKKIESVKDILSEKEIPFRQKDERLTIPLELHQNQVMVLLIQTSI